VRHTLILKRGTKVGLHTIEQEPRRGLEYRQEVGEPNFESRGKSQKLAAVAELQIHSKGD